MRPASHHDDHVVFNTVKNSFSFVLECGLILKVPELYLDAAFYSTHITHLEMSRQKNCCCQMDGWALGIAHHMAHGRQNAHKFVSVYNRIKVFKCTAPPKQFHEPLKSFTMPFLLRHIYYFNKLLEA